MHKRYNPPTNNNTESKSKKKTNTLRSSTSSSFSFHNHLARHDKNIEDEYQNDGEKYTYSSHSLRNIPTAEKTNRKRSKTYPNRLSVFTSFILKRLQQQSVVVLFFFFFFVLSLLLFLFISSNLFETILFLFRYDSHATTTVQNIDVNTVLHRRPNESNVTREGDTSEEYALLRKEYDELLPPQDLNRIQAYVSSLRKTTYQTIHSKDITYDIYNCPDHPPDHYPHAWNIVDVLQNWPPEDLTPHTFIYQSLCVFDFEKDQIKALHYRTAEVPFLVRNDPQVMRTVERWNQPHYLNKLFGTTKYMTEYSKTNQFIYWNVPPKKKHTSFRLDDNWTPPTHMVRMTFGEWLHLANRTTPADPAKERSDVPHWYYRIVACGKLGRTCDDTPAEFLFDELEFFRHDPFSIEPGHKSAIPIKPSLYLVDPHGQRGIHCRLGMKGITVANHYDASRNTLVVLGGERRYILSHPSQCANLDLFPPGHPSARHSAVDWSHPDDWKAHPNFVHAQVNEVVLQAGDTLYLPTHWFHFIISLNLTFQCNTRSGKSTMYDHYMESCGFSEMLRGN